MQDLRLCIVNLEKSQNVDLLDNIFQRYGGAYTKSISKNETNQFYTAFIQFLSEEAMEHANMELNQKPPLNFDIRQCHKDKKRIYSNQNFGRNGPQNNYRSHHHVQDGFTQIPLDEPYNGRSYTPAPFSPLLPQVTVDEHGKRVVSYARSESSSNVPSTVDLTGESTSDYSQRDQQSSRNRGFNSRPLGEHHSNEPQSQPQPFANDHKKPMGRGQSMNLNNDHGRETVPQSRASHRQENHERFSEPGCSVSRTNQSRHERPESNLNNQENFRSQRDSNNQGNFRSQRDSNNQENFRSQRDSNNQGNFRSQRDSNNQENFRSQRDSNNQGNFRSQRDSNNQENFRSQRDSNNQETSRSQRDSNNQDNFRHPKDSNNQEYSRRQRDQKNGGPPNMPDQKFNSARPVNNDRVAAAGTASKENDRGGQTGQGHRQSKNEFDKPKGHYNNSANNKRSETETVGNENGRYSRNDRRPRGQNYESGDKTGLHDNDHEGRTGKDARPFRNDPSKPRNQSSQPGSNDRRHQKQAAQDHKINDATNAKANELDDKETKGLGVSRRSNTATQNHQQSKPNELNQSSVPNVSGFRLPPGQFSEVQITTVVTPGSLYYVQNSTDSNKVNEMQGKVQKLVNDASILTNPTLNGRCLAKFSLDNLWYRAKVKRIDGDRRIISFVDFGNEEVYTGELRALPAELMTERPFAVKIKFSDRTPSNLLEGKDYGDKFEVMPVEKREGEDFWVVDLKHEKVNAVTPRTSEVLSDENVKFTVRQKRSIVNGNSSPHPAVTAPQAKPCPLPMETFSEVVVSTTLAPNLFFIQTKENLKKLAKMREIIMKTQQQLDILKDPKPNSLCLALFKVDNEWYRAQIVDVSNDDIRVKFIDYGNDEMCKSTDLRELPSELQSEQPLAFKVKLSETTSSTNFNKEYGQKLIIKPVLELKGNIWSVDVLTETDNKMTTSDSTSRPREASGSKAVEVKPSTRLPFSAHASKSLPPNAPTEVLFTYVHDNIYYGHPSAKAKDLVHLQKSLQTQLEFPLTYPKKGDLCCVELDNEWSRARILSLSTDLTQKITVQFIDYGDIHVCSVDKLKLLPHAFHSQPGFFSKFHIAANLSSGSFEPELFTKVKVDALDYLAESDCWVVAIPTDQSVKREASKPESSAILPKWPLDESTYSPVVVHCPVDEHTHYVVPAVKSSWVQENLFDNLKLIAPKAPQLSNPSVGTVCLAYDSPDWYRAKVVSLSPTVSVQLIDYGDTIKVGVNNLKEISQEVRDMPELLFKIKLAHSTSKTHLSYKHYASFNVKPVRFSKEENCWIVAVEGDPVPERTKPEMPKTVKSEPISKESTLAAPAVPISAEGYVSVTIIGVLDKNIYCGQLSDTDRAFYQFDQKLQKLAQNAPLCNGPMVGHNCLANSEGVWCRAKILSTEASSVSVELIDYGDKIKCSNDDLKEIPAELAKEPVRCIKFKLAEGTSEKFYQKEVYDKLMVKPIGFLEELRGWIVVVEGDLSASSEVQATFPAMEPIQPTSSKKQLPSCPIKENQFSSVTITCLVEKSIYHGQPTETTKSTLLLFGRVQSSAENAPPLSRPAVGCVCLVKYLGDWYRGEILSTEPAFTVQLLDYGDVFKCSVNDLREIPAELKDEPVYRFKFKLAEGSSEQHCTKKADENLNIKPVRFSEESGGWIVIVEGDQVDATVVEPSQPTFRKKQLPTCPIKENEFSSVTITCLVEKSIYYGQPTETTKGTLLLFPRVQSSAGNAPPLSRPAVGCVCLVKYLGDWYRGEILSTEPAFTVQLLDYGDVFKCSVNDLREIPAELKDEPVYCFKFELAEGSSEQHCMKKADENLNVKPVRFSEESGGWIVIVEGDQVDATVVEPSQPTSKKKQPPTCPIKENEFSSVTITCLVEKSIYYGQPTETTKSTLLLFGRVQSSAENAPPLSRPAVGCVCLVKYLGDWYRGEILSTEPAFTVQLLDYGDVFKCSVNDLREIPAELKDEPVYRFKFKLAEGSSEQHWMKKADENLNVKPVRFSEESGGWIVIVEGDQVNTTAVEPSQPTSSKKQPPTCPIKENEFSSVTITCLVEKSIYYGQPTETTNGTLLLFPRVQSSAENAPPLRRPAVGCVCLVKYLGDWYRGEILSTEPAFTVQLLDYGDVFKCSVNDLREIPAELKDEPVYRFKFKLAEGSSEQHCMKKADENLNVKPVRFSEESGGWIVIVEGDQVDATVVEPSQPTSNKKQLRTCPIKENEFSSVTITCLVEKSIYYGQPTETTKGTLLLFPRVQSSGENAPPLRRPAVGCVCLVKYLGDWYRGEILSTEPAFTVQLLDYGDVFKCSVNDLREIPAELKDEPVYRFKFELAEGSSEQHCMKKADENLNIKPVRFSEESGGWIVIVEGDQVDATVVEPSQPSSSGKQHHTCPIKENEFSSVTITCLVEKSVYYGQPTETTKSTVLLFPRVQSSATNAPLLSRPAVGCVCLVKYLGDWYRGEILSTEPPFTVQLLDYGDVFKCSVNDLREIPTELKDEPVYRFKFKLAEGSSEQHCMKKADENLNVKPVRFSEESNGWIVIVEGDQVNVVEKELRKSTSSRNQHHACPIEENQFSSVEVTYVVNKGEYYGQTRNQAQECEALFKKLHSANTSPLKSPAVGSLCLVPFDKLWYRARILTLQPSVTVQLFDYGDEIACPANDLKEIPPEYKTHGSLCFHFKLEDNSPNEYMSKKVYDSLNVKPVKFDETLNCWIVAASKTNSVSVSFPISERIFWAQKCEDRNNIAHLQSIIQAEACEAPAFYNPQPGDYCLASFQEVWYRAKILESEPKLFAEFVDRGGVSRCSSHHIKILPEKLKSTQPYAFKFMFSDSTYRMHWNKKLNERVRIKPILFRPVTKCWIVLAMDNFFNFSMYR